MGRHQCDTHEQFNAPNLAHPRIRRLQPPANGAAESNKRNQRTKEDPQAMQLVSAPNSTALADGGKGRGRCYWATEA